MPEHIEMQTERLLLRPFKLSDVDDVYAYTRATPRGVDSFRFRVHLAEPCRQSDFVHYGVLREEWEDRSGE